MPQITHIAAKSRRRGGSCSALYQSRARQPTPSRAADALDDDLRDPRARREAQAHAHDLGAVLRLDHLLGREARPLAPSACRRSPGQIAIARTPAASSSAFCERVSAITAAFVAP